MPPTPEESMRAAKAAGDDAAIIRLLRRHGGLQDCSEKIKASEVAVLAAVAQNGYALEHAAEQLKRNYSVVLAAVTENGTALQFAAQGLRADSVIAAKAIARSPYAKNYVDPSVLKRAWTITVTEFTGVLVAAAAPPARMWWQCVLQLMWLVVPACVCSHPLEMRVPACLSACT